MTGLLLALGVLLRSAHYLSNRSLWHDEVNIALDVLRRTPHHLLFGTSQTHEQTAPAGFLLAEKASTWLFGGSEYALRLVPFLASILALLVFERVARRLLAPRARWIALALFATAQPLVYFAAEVKQYSSDVLAGLLVLWLVAATPRERLAPSALIGLGLAGVLLPWLAFPALFFLAAGGLVLGVEALADRDRARLWRLSLVGLAWIGGFALLYFVSLRNLTGNPDLHDYWGGADSHAGAPLLSPYMPLPPASLRDLTWFWDTALAVFGYPGGLAFPGLALFGALAGVVALGRRSSRGLALLLLPLLFLLLASGLQRYPVFGRTVLFAVPVLMLLVGAGVCFVAESLADRSAATAGLLVAILFANPAQQSLHGLLHPPTITEARSVMEKLVDERQEGDFLYVNFGSLRPFEFYGPRLGLDAMDHVISPNSHRHWDWSLVEPDIAALRGRPRVWLLLSGMWCLGGMDEEQQLLLYADAAGRRLFEAHAPGASIYLYDFASRPPDAAP